MIILQYKTRDLVIYQTIQNIYDFIVNTTHTLYIIYMYAINTSSLMCPSNVEKL